MTENPLFARLRAFGIFSDLPEEGTPGILDLLTYLELSQLDCLTMRDLLQLTRLQSDPALFAVLALMFSLMAEGSLCLKVSPSNLASKLAPGCGQKTARQLADRFCGRLASGRYAALVGRDSTEYLPLVLEKRGDGELLYFQRLYVHEKSLERRMEAFLQSDRPVAAEQLDRIVDSLFSTALCLRRSAGGEPLEKDPQQVEALKRSLKGRFTIISGGPGTGKTSLMVNLVRALVRSGTPAGRILLGAPTGRAAQRLSEALQHYLATIEDPDEHDRSLLGLSGSTLHKMLGYRSSRTDFRYNAANSLPAEAVVLDEVSMVDVVMMDRFLQAVDARRTRVIFLGDKDQLPSVEAGAVFARMIPRDGRKHRFRDRMVLLEKVYRSGRQLVAFAETLNSGRMPRRDPVSLESALQMPIDSWCRVPFEGQHHWHRDLTRWLQVQYLQTPADGGPDFQDVITRASGRNPRELTRSEEGKALLTQLFRRVDSARILSLVRRGPLGCDRINQRLAAEISMAVEGGAAAPGVLFSGAVVLITRNDYGSSLFNGDVGIAVRDEGGLCRVYFKRAGAFIGFSREQLPAWEFGYAVTVHKSQGSEFDDVLLVLPADANHRLLSREIIYTGVTRARRRVIIYASQPVLDQALGRRIERTSGLSW